MKVWSGPRYMPETISNPDNVLTATNDLATWNRSLPHGIDPYKHTMASAAQSVTLQLNSEGAYRLALEPPIDIPYLAEPRARLSDMAFVNTAINVSKTFGNNTIDIELPYKASRTQCWI